jgi:hypothetical protein
MTATGFVFMKLAIDAARASGVSSSRYLNSAFPIIWMRLGSKSSKKPARAKPGRLTSGLVIGMLRSGIYISSRANSSISLDSGIEYPEFIEIVLSDEDCSGI